MNSAMKTFSFGNDTLGNSR